mmetsp:Transcript_17225/g.35477  ORF Transcript_17225/g.35477 Transcript_17225/m.35477 type:complete len:584 (+) Transcript_17225:142-1893(+)
MGNGIPHTLPATETKWVEAQKVIDRLENAMLEQRKKELSPEVLEGAIDVADSKGFNRINTPLVGRAEFLRGLVNHKFAEARVADYKKNWEWKEAEKDPEGELMQNLLAEKAEEERKAARRKKPETRFNFPKSNNPTLLVKVSNLSKITDEIMLRVHFDKTINPETKEPYKAGNFVRCHICQDENNNCNGTAFLEYPDEKQLEHALALDHTTIDYEKLKTADYGVDNDVNLTKHNTASFYSDEGWMLAGEGLQFDELAKQVGLSEPSLSAESDASSSPTKPGSPGKPGSPTKPSSPSKPEDATASEDPAAPPPTVNMTIVRSKVENMIISKRIIYDEDENIVGKVSDKPNIPDFMFYSCDKCKTWKKCFLPEDVMKEGGVEAVKATGIGSAEIVTAASGWKFSTSDFGATWTKLKKEIAADLPAVAETHQPVYKGNKRKKRKPRTISITVPTPIPLPPQAPSILRCIKIRVDGAQRIVKAHFYPPFNDLFKNPQSEQKIKDKTLILDYLKSVMSLDDVQYIPTGVASSTTNPWSEQAPKQGGAVGAYSKNIVSICSICHGCESDHSKCVRNHMLARATLSENEY